jgi:hypothetical protein
MPEPGAARLTMQNKSRPVQYSGTELRLLACLIACENGKELTTPTTHTHTHTNLDDEEVRDAKIGAEITDEHPHPAAVLGGVGPADGVTLPLVPQQRTDAAPRLDGDPGPAQHLGVELGAPAPLCHPRASHGAGDEPYHGAPRAARAQQRVGERHPGAHPDGVVGGVDAGVQRLPRLLPAQVGRETQHRGGRRAVARHHAVPAVRHHPAAAGHVGLPRQDEDQLVGRRHVGEDALLGQGGGGDEQEEEEQHCC